MTFALIPRPTPPQSKPRTGVAVGVSRARWHDSVYRAATFRLGRDVCTELDWMDGQRVLVLWGTGDDAGLVRIAPAATNDRRAVRLARKSDDNASLYARTQRVPKTMPGEHAIDQCLDWRINRRTDALDVALPEWACASDEGRTEFSSNGTNPGGCHVDDAGGPTPHVLIEEQRGAGEATTADDPARACISRKPLMRGSSAEEHRSHKPKVARSTRAPASNRDNTSNTQAESGTARKAPSTLEGRHGRRGTARSANAIAGPLTDSAVTALRIPSPAEVRPASPAAARCVAPSPAASGATSPVAGAEEGARTPVDPAPAAAPTIPRPGTRQRALYDVLDRIANNGGLMPSNQELADMIGATVKSLKDLLHILVLTKAVSIEYAERDRFRRCLTIAATGAHTAIPSRSMKPMRHTGRVLGPDRPALPAPESMGLPKHAYEDVAPHVLATEFRQIALARQTLQGAA